MLPAHQVPWPKSSSQAAADLFSTPPTQLAERLKSTLAARSAAAAAVIDNRLCAMSCTDKHGGR